MDEALARRIGRVAFDALQAEGSFDPDARLEDDALRARLAELGYEPHAPALAFERTWGGLRFDDFTFGPGACAVSEERGGAPGPGAGLVPVVLSDNDNYWFVGRDGRGWGQDGIEDPDAVPYASDGDRLVALVVLYAVAWNRRMSDLVIDLDGARGAEVAAALGLPAIPEATDELTRVWGDGEALVMEREAGTLVAVASAELLARVPR